MRTTYLTLSVFILLFSLASCSSKPTKDEAPIMKSVNEYGDEYTGQMVNGLKEGKGTMVYHASMKYCYEGEWKNDLQDGKGQLRSLREGARWKIAGIFKEGRILDAVLYDTCKNGESITATITNDKFTEPFKMNIPKDTLKSGEDYIAALKGKPACTTYSRLMGEISEKYEIRNDSLIIYNNVNLADTVLRKDVKLYFQFYVPTRGDSVIVVHEAYYVLPE